MTEDGKTVFISMSSLTLGAWVCKKAVVDLPDLPVRVKFDSLET